MRGIRLLITIFFVVSQFLVMPQARALDEDGGIEPVVITEIQVAGSNEFVELYNPNDAPLTLTGLQLQYRGSGSSYSSLANLDAVILNPNQFLVLGHFVTPVEGLMSFSTALNNTKGEVRIYDTIAQAVVDSVAWGDVTSTSGYTYYMLPAIAPSIDSSLQRCFEEGVLRASNPKNTGQDFVVYESELPTPLTGLACPVETPLEPVIDCTGIVINEIGANLSEQYIELYNPTSGPLPLAGCLLQTNRSDDTYTFTEESLGAEEYLAITITDTDLTLTKTTTGTVYFLTSDGLVEIDTQSYSELDENTSWSRFVSGWFQTYALTPNVENIDIEYPECDEGYYRNTETGRCNKVEEADVLQPCDVGQYRSPETNRCRNVLTATLLRPCDAGQYRNPETNRCRKVVAASALKACKPGYIRNAETNRCRKNQAGSVPTVGYKVETVPDSAESFAGWLALGGVGTVAGGYAGWEWRREVASSFRRLLELFKK